MKKFTTTVILLLLVINLFLELIDIYHRSAVDYRLCTLIEQNEKIKTQIDSLASVVVPIQVVSSD